MCPNSDFCIYGYFDISVIEVTRVSCNPYEMKSAKLSLYCTCMLLIIFKGHCVIFIQFFNVETDK